MSRLIHRRKPSEPTFWRTSAKRAASWFLQRFSLSFVSSGGFGRHSFASTAKSARGSCKWQQEGMNPGMNRGYESGDRFFRPERHQEYPRSTKTLRQWPRTDSCFHRVGQTAGSKLQVSSSAAAPPAAAPCKSQRLTPSCTPPATAPQMLQTTLVPGHPQDCSITPSIGTFH